MRKDSRFRGALLIVLIYGLLSVGAPRGGFADDECVASSTQGCGDNESSGNDATQNPLGGDLGGSPAPDVPTEGISLKDISAAIEDAFCTAAGAVFLTGTFVYLEGEGMMYLGRNAPPACGTLACAINPVHCSTCKKHWQRVSDMAGGATLKLLGAALGAAGGAGVYLCAD